MRIKGKKTSSKYYGVTFRKTKSGGSWAAQITKGGRVWYGGSFEKEIYAARAVAAEQIKRGIEPDVTLTKIAIGIRMAAGRKRSAAAIAAGIAAEQAERHREDIKISVKKIEYQNGYLMTAIDCGDGQVVVQLEDPRRAEYSAAVMLSEGFIKQFIKWLSERE